jgi:hypothetical protein
MKIKIVLILLAIILLEYSCFAPKFKLNTANKTENAIMFVSFTADKATCFCIEQYYSNDIFINAIDSIISQAFICDTTYEKGLGYVVSMDQDSTSLENITVEQVRLLDIWYSHKKGVFLHNGYLFLLSGKINPDLFQSSGKDTCLIGIKPEFLLQKYFLAPCLQWSFLYDGHGHILKGNSN